MTVGSYPVLRVVRAVLGPEDQAKLAKHLKKLEGQFETIMKTKITKEVQGSLGKGSRKEG